jgi:ubiquinone/menaquinone biosynthesis C-methylase UbiE
MLLTIPKYIYWIARGRRQDIVRVYNSLVHLIELANGGLTLNRGYWDIDTQNPLEAQHKLCKLIGKFADFDSAKTLLDTGSGFSYPASIWNKLYCFENLICIDINPNLLKAAIKGKQLYTEGRKNHISFVNGTSTQLPIASESISRIVALESIHHFRPLNAFISECRRVLEPDGNLVIATPVKFRKYWAISGAINDFIKLGIVSLLMSSKNYGMEFLESMLKSNGFEIREKDIVLIGSHVYNQVTEYYLRNRELLRERFAKDYPSMLEYILCRSVLNTNDAYNRGLIDYALIRCLRR